MKYILLLSIILTVSCCTDNDEAEFKKECPYELAYGGHYLRVPITISPHKLQYKIGDTININTIFSDSIYDLGTQQTFKIAEFPFKPSSLLYRFTKSNSYDSGYRVNQLKIDSAYNHVYSYSSNYADGYRAHTVYDGNEYRFESQLILNKKGRYVLFLTDMFQNYNGSGNGDLNEEANDITFEGKCPGLQYYLCSMIDSGDDHLDLFKDELVYLDEEIYRGKLGSIEAAFGPLKWGSIAVEFSGFFGFEVVE